VARSLATDERVLVHIFECPEQRPDQPTVQWVLESFHAIAPGPPELVLGTGKYGGTTYAYLVTKLPESAVLDKWVRSYRVRQEACAESPFAASPSPQQSPDEGVEEPAHGIPMTVPDVAEAEQPPTAGTSQTSSDSDSSFLSDNTAAQEHDATVLFARGSSEIDFGPAKVESQEPGEFTRQFFSGPANLHDNPVHPAPSLSTSESGDRVQSTPATHDLASPKSEESAPGRAAFGDAPSGFSRTMPPAAENSRETSAHEDLSGYHEGAQPENSLKNVAATEDDGTRAGEFTSFFQGPFHGERAAKVPPVSTTWAKPKNEAGEFTKVFGNSRNAPASEGTSSPRFTDDTFAGRNREENSGLRKSAETPEVYPSPAQQTEILEANRSQSTAFPDPSPRATVPTAHPIDPPPQPATGAFSSGGAWHDADTAFIFRPKKEAATSAFAAPGSETAPAHANLPTGPSEFTRIISGGLRNLESGEEEPAAAGRQDFLEKLSPPVVPSGLPAFRDPLPPGQFPQGGSFPQTPMPPTPGTPALPQIPQLGAAAPKVAATPWTLILILNGLFLVAILLVLYFALKH